MMFTFHCLSNAVAIMLALPYLCHVAHSAMTIPFHSAITPASANGGLCFTSDTIDPTRIYVVSCTNSSYYTSSGFYQIFAVGNAGGVVTATQASYFTGGILATLPLAPGQQSGLVQVSVNSGNATYTRIDAKSDFFNPGDTQVLSINQAYYTLAYDQSPISTSTNDFFGDSGTGSGLGHATTACIVPAATPTTCGSPTSFQPATAKYSLFIRLSGTHWVATANNYMAYGVRQHFLTSGYTSIYFNGDPALNISTVGMQDVTSITFVSPDPTVAPTFTATYPSTFYTGSYSYTGSATATTITDSILVPSHNGTVHIKFFTVGGFSFLDYVFLGSEIPCAFTCTMLSCNCYIVYDPTIEHR